MKNLPLMFLTLLLAALALGQAAVKVEVMKIELARDNGRGKPGSVVKTLAPNDNPFHCVVHLKPLVVPTLFTGTLIAVDAAGKKGVTVAMANLSASTKLDLIEFKFSLPRPWPTGTYRFELRTTNGFFKTFPIEVK